MVNSNLLVCFVATVYSAQHLLKWQWANGGARWKLHMPRHMPVSISRTVYPIFWISGLRMTFFSGARNTRGCFLFDSLMVSLSSCGVCLNLFERKQNDKRVSHAAPAEISLAKYRLHFPCFERTLRNTVTTFASTVTN